MQPLEHTKSAYGLSGARSWILVIMAMNLSACMTLDKFVCTGTGTCDLNPKYQSVTAAKWVSPTPQTVITNNGTYMIMRNQSTGAINSINQVSRGK